MRPETQKLACAKVLRIGHFQAIELIQNRHRHKIWMRCRERMGNVLVLLGQHAACGINQTATRFQQSGSTVQNGSLSCGHFCNTFRLLSPFQIGIAAQSAQARARGIDQHTINLARKAFNTIIALVRNGGGVHIGQLTARQARFQSIQAMR